MPKRKSNKLRKFISKKKKGVSAFKDDDRQRKQEVRNAETTEQTASRQEKDRMRAMEVRNAETTEQTANRQEKLRMRAMEVRNAETTEQTASRQEKLRMRAMEVRNAETTEQTASRQKKVQMKMKKMRSEIEESESQQSKRQRLLNRNEEYKLKRSRMNTMETEDESNERHLNEAQNRTRSRANKAAEERANSDAELRSFLTGTEVDCNREEEEDTILDYENMTPGDLKLILERSGEKVFENSNNTLGQALFLFYANAGLLRFDQWKDFSAHFDGKEMDIEALMKELDDERLTDEEMKLLAIEFLSLHSYTAEPLFSCATCGVRQMGRIKDPSISYSSFVLGEDGICDLFKYSQEDRDSLETIIESKSTRVVIPVNESWDTIVVDAWKARSVYIETHENGEKDYWHVHPELVENVMSDTNNVSPVKHRIKMCPCCFENAIKGKLSKYSIANGVDFGDYRRVGLSPLNLHEQLIVAKTRLYFALIKTVSNQKGSACNKDYRSIARCHAILFPHNSPEVLSYIFNNKLFNEGGILDIEQLKNLFCMCFIDEKNCTDHLMKVIFGAANILGKSWMVAQWLLVMNKVNKNYLDLDVSNLNQERMENVFEKLHQAVKKECMVINDKKSIELEECIGSDIAGNQFNDLSGENQHDDLGENDSVYSENVNDEVRKSSEDPHIRYSYITNTEKSYLNVSSNDYRMLCLQKLVGDNDCEANISHLQTPKFVNMREDCDSDSSDCENNKDQDDIESYHVQFNADNDDHVVDDNDSIDNDTDENDCNINVEDVDSVEGENSQWEGKFSDDDSVGDDENDNYIDPKNKCGWGCSAESRWEQMSINDFTTDDTDIKQYVQSLGSKGNYFTSRLQDPLSDFQGGDVGMTTSFPDIFFLGTAYGKKLASLNNDDRYHLLNQFTLHAARDRRYLGFLFDTMQRTRVCQNVSAYVEGNRRAMEIISNLLEKDEEKKKLKEAINFPYLKQSKELLKKYLSVLKFAARDISYGVLEGSRLKQRAYGCMFRSSIFNIFLTISPQNIGNPRSLRLSCQTVDNTKFPAVFNEECEFGTSGEDFINYMAEHAQVISEGDIILPEGIFNKADRSRLSAENPVAFVLENKMMLNDILGILIGLPPDIPEYYSQFQSVSSRKTRYYKRRKGIFGHPLSLVGVTEDHHRGHLHWHLAINAGIPVQVLQKFANIPKLCDKISEVLDQTFSCNVEIQDAARAIARNTLWEEKKGDNVTQEVVDSLEDCEGLLHQANMLDKVKEEEIHVHPGHSDMFDRFNHWSSNLVALMQFHRHQGTCYKGKWGKSGCRLNMPMAIVNGTKAILLSLKQKIKGKGSIPKQSHNETEEEPSPSSPTSPNANINCKQIYEEHALMGENVNFPREATHSLKDMLLISKKKEVVVWELKRNIFELPSFLQADIDVEKDKQQFISDLKNLLQKVNGIPEQELKFWNWLEKTASNDQIVKLHSDLKEKLPFANGNIASFNPILTYCTGSHNNASYLGSMSQAKSAVYYIIPYQGKTKFDFKQCLPILHQVVGDVSCGRVETKSTKDTGTLGRTTKLILERTLNKMDDLMEISDWQATAGLLALPSAIFAERFAYGNVHSLIAAREEMDTEGDRAHILDNMLDRIANDDEQKTREQGRKQQFYKEMDDFIVESDNEKEQESENDSIESDPDQDENNDNKKDNDSESNNCNVNFQQFEAESQSEQSDLDAQDKNTSGQTIHNPPQDTLQDISDDRKDAALQWRDLGHISKIVVEKKTETTKAKSILVPTAVLFLMKGEELSKKINYYEYLGCIQFQNKPCPSRQKTNKKDALKFAMNSLFQGHINSCHAIRIKQCTPLLNGKMPTHPGKEPTQTSKNYSSWKERADKYANYYLTLFRPFYCGDGQSYRWEDLQTYISNLQKDDSAISIFRLMTMDQHMQGMNSPEACRKMTLQFRARARTLWDEMHKASKEWRESWENGKEDKNFEALFDAMLGRIPTVTMDQMELQLKHDDNQVKEMEKVFESKAKKLSKMPTRNIKNKCGIDFKNDVELLISKCAKMKDWETDHIDPIKGNSGLDLDAKLASIRSKLTKQDGSNTQQLELYDECCEFFRSQNYPSLIPPDFPQMILVHGCPGVGKSMLRDAICEASSAVGNYNLKTAFNAINATEMGGYTTAYLVRLNAKKHILRFAMDASDMIKDLQKEGFDTNSLIIMDECSTEATWHVAQLQRFCQYANNEQYNMPMGGNPFFAFGDWTQLGPVRAGKTIPQAIVDIYGDEDVRTFWKKNKPKCSNQNVKGVKVKWNRTDPHCPYHQGATLFTKMRWFELSQQMRCTDPIHTAFVEAKYKGNRIKSSTIFNGYKHLSKNDMNLEEWINASTLVSTNRERFSLTHIRAKQFAAYYGTVIIRWKKMIGVGTWEGQPREEQHMNQAMTDPCFL